MSAPREFRQRYIAFEVERDMPEERLSEVLSELWEELDYSYYVPWLVTYDRESGEGLVKCGHLQVDEVKMEMEDVGEVNIRIRGVSGTIKKARMKFLSL